ncbi:MAG: hypothetical protein LBG67_04610 [Campylobacteraceae bacterium]|nr:hypothetical protein [Campylobacteraceae bacterium]
MLDTDQINKDILIFNIALLKKKQIKITILVQNKNFEDELVKAIGCGKQKKPVFNI